jgi:xanthine dehydrogenase accessory factor
MRDLSPQIERWRSDGKQVAIATVVQVYGAALRPVGSKMAISSAGDIAGSVSGGCVEGAVFEQAQAVIKQGQPRLVEYGVSNESAWDIGLACGGAIQIWVERLDDEMFVLLRESVQTGEPMAWATVVDGQAQGRRLFIWPDGRTAGDLVDAELTEQTSAFATSRLALQAAGRTRLVAAGTETDVFVDVYSLPARLIVVGAVHIAIPLVAYAKTLGLRTVVVDARSAFATRTRFPHADELIVEWPSTALENLRPDQASNIVILTHDDKFDLPALQTALAGPARYIGILGSRKSQARRLEALKQLGMTDEQLSRIHAPIGLAIGAVGPEEIALSIVAEIVAVWHGVATRQAMTMSVETPRFAGSMV